MTLTVVVITKNEEQNIYRCLDAVRWADEIIVVDSQSTDNTLEIVKQFHAKVYSPVWRGYGPAKREGVAHATSDWVLSVDADEVVTPELAEEIRDVIKSETSHDGYYMNRCTNFLGRWIYHCGWYPDRVLRLFRREKGNVTDSPVHERVEVTGTTGYLKGELLHYSYPTLELYLEKSNRYTTLGAEEAYNRGKRFRLFDIVIRPMVSFISHYIVKQGFRDGVEGLLISVLSSIAVMVKYAKLRQMYKHEKMKAETDVERN